MTETSKPKDYSLSYKNHYHHFLLLHDFLFKLTKTKATDSDYFDLQIEVNNGMKTAVDVGSRVFQLGTFGCLCYYFLRGNSVKLKFFWGFLYTYWYNHIMTLGSYAGAFVRIPSIFSLTQHFTTKQFDITKNILRLKI